MVRRNSQKAPNNGHFCSASKKGKKLIEISTLAGAGLLYGLFEGIGVHAYEWSAGVIRLTTVELPNVLAFIAGFGGYFIACGSARAMRTAIGARSASRKNANHQGV